jgi:hypothetical protein
LIRLRSSLLTASSSPGLVRDALRPNRHAEFDARNSASGCMPNTREYVLGLIQLWSEGPPVGLSIFWLAGMAGTGKTTIAKTACERFVAAGRFGASFFATHADKDRRDACCILRTLAYQLALKCPAVFRQVYQCIKDEYDISSQPLEEQLQKVLVAPLLLAKGNFPENIIVVVDALDECDAPESMELIRLLVSKLRSFNIKLLLTSRNERVLQEMFKHMSPANLQLHDVKTDIVAEDVRRYIATRLAQIAVEREIKTSGWPSKSDVEALTERTGPFFIYAATSIGFIGDSHYNPIQQLRLLLGSRALGTGKLDAVDDLYTRILEQSTLNDRGKEDPDLCHRIHLLLGTIVTVVEPLRIGALASLLEVEEQTVQHDISLLGSVLFNPRNPSRQPVRVLHASLPDFLLGRCVDVRFRVSASKFHAQLALRCIRILNSGLRRDICDIRNASLRNNEVPDLVERLDTNVPQYLRYACRHWHVHMRLAGEPSNTLMKHLRVFCETHLHHWAELLSLMGELWAGIGALTPLLHLLRVRTGSATAIIG